MNIPKIKSKWRHKKRGYISVVIALANTTATRADWHPIHIVYEDPSGDVWTNEVEEWHERFEELEVVLPDWWDFVESSL